MLVNPCMPALINVTTLLAMLTGNKEIPYSTMVILAHVSRLTNSTATGPIRALRVIEMVEVPCVVRVTQVSTRLAIGAGMKEP